MLHWCAGWDLSPGPLLIGDQWAHLGGQSRKFLPHCRPTSRPRAAETRVKRLRLSAWNVNSTIILSFWTLQKYQGCPASWRGGAMLNSASRQDVGSRQIQRL